MPSTHDHHYNLIPIGSWDTADPFHVHIHATAPFGNGEPKFSPRLFLGSESVFERDFTIVHALQLLNQLGILSYTEHHRANWSLHKQPHQGTRLLIYAHSRRRPFNYEYHNDLNNNSRHSKKNGDTLQQAKRALTMVLLNMNVDPWSFHNPTTGIDHTGKRPSFRTLFQNDMKRRLIDIYMEMPSPRASDDPYLDQPIRAPTKATERLLQQAIERDSPRGMRTKLYQYQKNSLWKLLRRELCPDLMLDPSTVALQDMNGDPYYLDLAVKEPFISRTPATQWEDIPGGIICEDMGTGKTCLCIALILHTLHQSSRPPTEEPTQLFCDLIPNTPSAATANSDFKDMVLPRGAAIPSLRNYAAATIKTRAVDYRHAQDYISPDVMDTLENALLYYHDDGSLEQNRQSRSRQTKNSELPVEIYLSSATLVIVPPNLIDQWCNEINKHTEDSALKLFTITKATQEFPDLRTLMSYDLVLISQSRFEKEYVPGAYSLKHSLDKTNCKCNTVYDHCRCIPPQAISPLMQIRWKRIIVDEGHSMGSKMSDRALFAKKLHADRRWICTGTPTTNLANLELSSSATTGAINGQGNFQQQQQQAALSDKSDLDRLSVLVESFLHLPPYTFDRSRFTKEVQKPFLEHQQHHHSFTATGRKGFSCGSGAVVVRDEWTLEKLSSTLRLKYLMRRIMVRNRSEDVARNVTLPPLQERIVLLDLEYFQLLALNCQIAMIQANAVLSERQDQDYFFHPRNRKLLALVIGHLKDGCFWYLGGFGYKDKVVETLKNVQVALEKHDRSGGTKYSQDDYQMLLDVSSHLRTALESSSWRAIETKQEVGYYCQNLPTLVQAKHAIIPSASLHATNTSFVKSEPLEQQVRDEEEGSLCVMLGKEILSLRDDVVKAEQAMEIEQLVRPENAERPAAGSMDSAIDLTMDDENNAMLDLALKEAISQDRLSRSVILSSTSSKLNYIASQILRHQGSEKCIIFCQSENVMYYIREYLSLAKVRCLMYHTNGMTETQRSSNIMTFNTSEAVSTMIMQTDLAAYGIDLSSASRVYFVSPVWRTATLRQAIKRAHRIGQVRPVFVETLVIRDSFEEKVLNRRREIDESARGGSPAAAMEGVTRSNRGKDMLDDGKVQDLIRNIEFMSIPQTRAPNTTTTIASMNCEGETEGQPEAPHNVSTLADYVGILRYASSSYDDSASKFVVPVVFPSKESARAQQQQRRARESRDVPSVDVEERLEDQQSVTQDGRHRSDDASGGEGSSGRKKLRFNVDADMDMQDAADQNTNDPKVLLEPKKESNAEDRQLDGRHRESMGALSLSAEEIEEKEERRQKQELEIQKAKDTFREAQNRQLAAEEDARAAQEQLLLITQRYQHIQRQHERTATPGRREHQHHSGSSVGNSIVVDSDDEVVVVELKQEDVKEEEKDVESKTVCLKFEDIKLEDRKLKVEDRKVKRVDVKGEEVEEVKRQIKIDDDHHTVLFKDLKIEPEPIEHYELFDHSDDDEEPNKADKKPKQEPMGSIREDTIVVQDSDSEPDSDDSVYSFIDATSSEAAFRSRKKMATPVAARGRQGVDDMDMDERTSAPLPQQLVKRENDQPHHLVDDNDRRLTKRVRF
ncbi:hypothetical protein BGX23_005076 [Mortierella sp. AD031]|nr:hypothetical protein BGX23_005076 [Mortierella sp. AD031]